MIRFFRYTALVSLLWLASSCKEILEPEPYDIRVDDLALKRAADVPTVRIGLYNAFRALGPGVVVSGDFTADNIQHNGTFSDYREFGTKQITSTNGNVSSLWAAIYNAIYLSNFIQERLPAVSGVTEANRKQLIAEARFVRGFCNFIGAYTYGDIPQVKTTDQATNRNIPRTPKATILQSVLEDYQAALADLPETPQGGVAYAGKNTARAALARFYLYQKNWVQAEQFATQVISSGKYSLEPDFETIVTQNFTRESILETGYTINDESANGLNNLLVGRREVIPSNQLVAALLSGESGDRIKTLSFDATKLRGSDNAWTVRKYGTALQDNANVVYFRLAEMYLIRAEARAQQGKLAGANGAIADLNVLRSRAKATQLGLLSQTDALLAVERERQYELAFEGHRWYDLVRTGRAQIVMTAFSTNWNSRYELWPIPQSETQRNPALKNAQNPGY